MCLHRESDKKKGITFGGVQRPLGRPTLALVVDLRLREAKVGDVSTKSFQLLLLKTGNMYCPQ